MVNFFNSLLIVSLATRHLNKRSIAADVWLLIAADWKKTVNDP